MAWMACHSSCATTARKLPSRTTLTTPGIFSTAALSTPVSTAPYDGGRTMRACTMPGRRMSCT